MSIRNLLVTTLTCCGMAIGIPGYFATADEWWEDSPYYEEEAWYDVTEWFDGNDYTYTATTDSDDDWGYDSDYDYDYDTGYYDGYGYNYYGDYYDTYGYDNRYEPDNWFYDYWDDGYAYYNDWDNDGIYDTSYSYYDYDGDGFYDAYFSYNDWDDDGIYDDVEYYAFNDNGNDQGNSANSSKQNQKDRKSRGQQEPESSKRQMVQGEVLKTKKASVRDTKHLIVQLEKSGGNKCLVDLGPANRLQEMDIQEGDQISVRGPMTKAGDRRILIAQEIKGPDQSQGAKQIQRDGQEFRGRVADTRTKKIRGKQHTFFILASADKDKKMLVDLGATDQLDIDPEQDDQIRVTAVPVKVNDRVVLMAQEVNCKGKKCKTEQSAGKSHKSRNQQDRHQSDWQSRTTQASSQRPARSITGQVQSTREVTVRGNDRKLATIKSRNGDRLMVDLGPAGEFDEHLRNGDTITVRGPMVKTSDNKPVILARTLERDGEKIELGRRGTMHSDATQKTIRGEIESTRKVTVRGKQRHMAKIETDEGNTVIVDLGAPYCIR